MKANYILWVLLAAIAMLSGCTKPLDVVIPTDKEQRARTLAKVIDKLPSQDQDRLRSYLARAMFAEVIAGSPAQSGITVGQALQSERDREEVEAKEKSDRAERDKEEAKKKAERIALEQQMHASLAVSVRSKTEEANDPDVPIIGTRMKLDLSANNSTSTAIAGFKGRLEFRDMFGDLIFDYAVKVDQPIEARTQLDWSERVFGGFDPGARKLAQTDLSKLKVGFVPEVIVFTDGAKLELPPEEPSGILGLHLP